LKGNGNITLEAIAQKLKVSKKTVYRETTQLQLKKIIERVGSNNNGEWKVL
jgi:DeoR/GlpR family transcriptional regulator of sugar metabolism